MVANVERENAENCQKEVGIVVVVIVVVALMVVIVVVVVVC